MHARTGSPLASIVLPVFNGERYLKAAIRSALDLDWRPLEVIVVDDGSSDASGEIARSFPVRYLWQERAGPGAARNTGVRASAGRFIGFVDADDILLPHKLRVQVSHLVGHPETGCTLARSEFIIEEAAQGALPFWTRRDRLHGDMGGIPPLSAVVPRTVFEASGGFDPSFRVAEDSDWLFRLRAAGVRIDVLDEIVMHRRVHDANLTHQVGALREGLARSLRARVAEHRDRRGRA